MKTSYRPTDALQKLSDSRNTDMGYLQKLAGIGPRRTEVSKAAPPRAKSTPAPRARIEALYPLNAEGAEFKARFMEISGLAPRPGLDTPKARKHEQSPKK